MGNHSKRSHLWSIIVIAVVLLVYAFGAALNAMNAREAGIIYKRDEGVALECVLTWDAAGLQELLELAEEMEIPLTFFMTADFAAGHGERVAAIQEKGFEIGLLCEDASALVEDLAALYALGVGVEHVMPARGVRAAELEDVASELGLFTVLCTFELKNNTTNPEALIQRVADSSFDGAIIRFEPAKTTIAAFSGIIEILRQMGLTPKGLSGGT